ncbi:hypothetical protein ACQJBY_018951 [Aegilops geniculata]
MNPDRKTALELSIRAYAESREGHVISPKIGTEFDSLDEAYEFYNLYSWETGFGIRLAKSRLNVERVRWFPIEREQPFVKMWLQCNDKAAEIQGCWLKMHWKSHRHIDRYTKDLVKQLRDNNVSLGKVFSIVGSFFGAAENVPFTKRSLKTLCRKLNKEQSDLDAVKTMNMLADMKADDPEFNYTVQVDEESRIRTLMTNLYDMPFGLFVGVNNHFQSIIFGGAMMRDEKEETFKWIFREFVRMVGGKHPQTILTGLCA